MRQYREAPALEKGGPSASRITRNPTGMHAHAEHGSDQTNCELSTTSTLAGRAARADHNKQSALRRSPCTAHDPREVRLHPPSIHPARSPGHESSQNGQLSDAATSENGGGLASIAVSPETPPGPRDALPRGAWERSATDSLANIGHNKQSALRRSLRSTPPPPPLTDQPARQPEQARPGRPATPRTTQRSPPPKKDQPQKNRERIRGFLDDQHRHPGREAHSLHIPDRKPQ